MESELFDAIETKDLDKIKELIEKGVNVNARDEYEFTPLNNLWIPDIEIAKYLIQQGADLNTRSISGYTPLISVCQNYTSMYEELKESDREKCFEFIKLLIDSGSDINAKLDCGYTSIHYGDVKIVKLLLEKGADVSIGGKEAFISFCENGDIEIVKLLLDKGVDINSKDRYGRTALMYAYYTKHTKIFNLLLDRGADISPLSKKKNIDYILMKYYMSKAKEHSDLLKEDLIKKYYSPENIEKWSVYYSKDFDEVQDLM